MNKLEYILIIVNMVAMVVLIIMVSVQNKSTGLSNVFGGGGGVTTTRRGVEKWLFYATIAIAVIFVGLSITSLFLQK
jgi:preprotein translocase subunit SecG